MGKIFLGILARRLIVLAVTFIVARPHILGQQAGDFIQSEQFISYATLVLLSAFDVGRATWYRVLVRVGFIKAKEAAPNATVAEVRAEVQATTFSEKMEIANDPQHAER